MLTYFARRLIGGVITFLVSTFVLYTAIVPLGASVLSIKVVCMHCARQPIVYSYLGTYSIYKLDHPWPSSYFRWLYDPAGHELKTFILKAEPRQSARWIPGRTVQFTSLGLLRGDFGQSLSVQPGTPTLAAYGIDLLPWTAFIGTLLVGSMAVAYLQRRNQVGNVKA